MTSGNADSDDPTDDDPTDAALLAVARAMMAVSLRAAVTLPAGISPIQLRALTVLSGLGQTNLADLGAALGMSPSSTSRLCDRLVAGGLVERRTSPHTRREVAVRLSGEGTRLLAGYDGHRLAELRAVLDSFGPRRRQEVLGALRDFGAAARAADIAAGDPRVR
ncbi:MAG TPA: MarR family winged helix-turn-helix transcriptional regulator [Pseudonocardiaceae bacterium]|jgi:DNA-binding MarR family transcriptional regulator